VTPMTPGRRLAGTALMYAITLAFLAVAGVTHEVWPLFVGGIPLLVVPWLLTRPERGDAVVGPDGSASGDDAAEGPATPAPTEGIP
jgi:hypothetical protein